MGLFERDECITMGHRFSTGFGALTAQRLTEWGETSQMVADQGEIWGYPTQGSNVHGPYPCIIKSATRMAATGANKWKWLYRLVTIQFDASTPTITETVNMFDTVTDIAINLAEQSNTETIASGITVADLPGDFELQPIPVGAYVMAWLISVPDDDTPILPMFSRPGEFDGECT